VHPDNLRPEVALGHTRDADGVTARFAVPRAPDELAPDGAVAEYRICNDGQVIRVARPLTG
jgi:hypothetical protein